jgi:hypothetical protein
MSTYAIFQALVIALALVFSAWSAFRRLLPATASRWQAKLAATLNQPGRAGWAHALARRMQPKTATGNCGDGCGTCGSCGPRPAQSDVQPLHFRPRAKP